MNARIHACLDGELPRSALSAEEVRQLEEVERALGSTAETVRTAPAPDLTARVMAGLPALHPAAPSPLERIAAAVHRGVRWAWAPRPLVIRPRPVYGFAAAFALALLVWNAPAAEREAAGVEMAAAAGEAPSLFVQFRFEAPGASRVQLAGSFTGWAPQHELQETAPGVWTALVRLEPGVHEYLFVVDGEQWVADPVAPAAPDSFGGVNSRLFLAAPTLQT